MSNSDDVLAPHSVVLEGLAEHGLAANAERCVGSRAKRILDLVGSSVGLVLLLPLFVLIGVVVYAHDRGPVFFRQQRTGLHGQVFKIWKFRTMRLEEASTRFRQTSGRCDPRITPIGRFLRATSLDELPQLINIVSGQMSLVGPRPHPVALDKSLAPQFKNYRMRQSVRPGLTGLAQIMGARGPVNCPDDMERRLRHDLTYIRGWSVFGDIKIVVATILSPSAGKKAY